MQPNSGTSQNAIAGRSEKGASAIKIICVLGLLGFVWFQARGGAFAVAPVISQPQIGTFAAQQVFVVWPGGNGAHGNVRAGPGTTYSVIEQITRGSSVNGEARVVANDGSTWIVLANGRGYMKESVLRPMTDGSER